MEQFIIYWALIVAPTDMGRIDEVYRTYEPCHVRAENYRKAGITAECIPTTSPEIMRSEQQLRALATLIYDRTDGHSR